MKIRKLMLIALAALASCAVTSTRLDSLAAELKQRRALPAGTPTDCPENLKSLVGSTLAQVKAALGPPDTWRKGEIAYSFGSPWDGVHVGGGSPEVTFVAGEDGLVTDVPCLYSQ